ncbi:hypothetical protein SJ05684_a40150 (plasmid) [Sinorhizobium sojae CCBAU 05684]|uniref:Uncharacterized protein n=1 Tax=Sinorhizobium sojae CCBAU 05684 TaxID=716928 RepID=A0A249PN25_9HYPH|nr:hypothetical protein SS05631_a45000 [Sinorhizobium sp. CCBAU 05631]ASY67328.1 hypothetical protein SJ05684_a40150 [Sinorhizobium sojae CCBAU 05684]
MVTAEHAASGSTMAGPANTTLMRSAPAAFLGGGVIGPPPKSWSA